MPVTGELTPGRSDKPGNQQVKIPKGFNSMHSTED